MDSITHKSFILWQTDRSKEAWKRTAMYQRHLQGCSDFINMSLKWFSFWRLVAKATRKATVFEREFEKRLRIRGGNQSFMWGIYNHEYNVARRVTGRIQIEQIDKAATSESQSNLLTRDMNPPFFLFPFRWDIFDIQHCNYLRYTHNNLRYTYTAKWLSQ